jgi:hypothetical protein
MAKQDLEELGFRERPKQEAPEASSENEEKKRAGFIGGLQGFQR